MNIHNLKKLLKTKIYFFLICVTIYNEDQISFLDTLNGIYNNKERVKIKVALIGINLQLLLWLMKLKSFFLKNNY